MPDSSRIVEDAFIAFKKKIIEIDYLQSVTKSVYHQTLEKLDHQIGTESSYTNQSSLGANFWIKNISTGSA
jgi:hypothetical protein